MDHYRMWIGGQWVESSDGQHISVIDPATEEVVARVPRATVSDVNMAVERATAAFHSWRETDPKQREQTLFNIAGVLRRHAPELARIESINSGKPLREAEGDVSDAIDVFEYYGGLATKITGEVVRHTSTQTIFVLQEPVGVVAQIIPWNFPLMMSAWKIAPALAAGCTVVLKPAEQTPLSILRAAQLLHEEEILPHGTVNIVTGYGPEAGAALVRHPGIAKIAFTGSVETGRYVAREAAAGLKRVSLELGGKSPAILFPDADFESVVNGALFGVFLNQGEVCAATSRVLVHRSIYRDFVDAAVEGARRIRLGHGLDPSTTMGPVISRPHQERVYSYIEEAKADNIKLALGGERPTGDLTRGCFVEPTIFYDVPVDARIAREEIFGPVMTVMPFDAEDEAICLANDSSYGLAAAVWTKDIHRAFRVLRQVEAGIVWINASQPASIYAPWGGMKDSGYGRDLGRWGLEQYLQTKQSHINVRDTFPSWF